MPRARKWSGVEAKLLAQVAGVEDPAQAICLLVDDLLMEAEQDEPPIELGVVASFQGVRRISCAAIKDAAMISPTAEGLEIFVNIRDPEGRQNFSIAHEICHTLFPHFRAHPVVKDAETGTFSIRNEEEWLCDLGASHLLLPPRLLLPKAQQYGPSLDCVSKIAEDFKSSLEAAAIALADLNLWPYAIVFFEEALKPSQLRLKDQMVLPTLEDEFRLEPELRISTACVPASLGIYLPKHKSVRRNGAIYQALATQGRTNGRDLLELRNGPVEILAESIFAPYKKEGQLRNRVVSFITVVDL